MYLPDHEIIKLCQPGTSAHPLIESATPLIDPLDLASVGPASVDLRTGRKFASPQILHAYVIRDGVRIREVSSMVVDGATLCKPSEEIEVSLEPSQVVACHSAERVCLPSAMLGHLFIRSSYAREWITHSTAQLIQPGFFGNITFELANTGPRAVSLRSGDKIMQLTFARLASESTTPYGKQSGSKYQNQNAELRSLRVVTAS
jgi:deoxycytidine triphosphate deaminase